MMTTNVVSLMVNRRRFGIFRNSFRFKSSKSEVEPSLSKLENELDLKSNSIHPIIAYLNSKASWKWEIDQGSEDVYRILRSFPKHNTICGRSMPAGDLALKLKSPALSSPQERFIYNCDMSNLLEVASVSPFGKGDQTVFDENVRKGKELKADEIDIILPKGEKSICEMLWDIDEDIKRKLFPHKIGAKLEYKFYKLALYEQGGHFDFHRDSTHSDDHHVTLLIGLNSKFEGEI